MTTLLSSLDGQSILAELIRPGTFSAIVAVDPTMFPEAMDIHQPLPDNPLAQSTLRRRDTWKDRYALGLMELCTRIDSAAWARLICKLQRILIFLRVHFSLSL